VGEVENGPSPITLVSGLYNSLYYCTNRDLFIDEVQTATVRLIEDEKPCMRKTRLKLTIQICCRTSLHFEVERPNILENISFLK